MREKAGEGRTTHRVPAQLVEQVDCQLAHVLVLVEEPEAERLQTMEVRREPGKELKTPLLQQENIE